MRAGERPARADIIALTTFAIIFHFGGPLPQGQLSKGSSTKNGAIIHGRHVPSEHLLKLRRQLRGQAAETDAPDDGRGPFCWASGRSLASWYVCLLALPLPRRPSSSRLTVGRRDGARAAGGFNLWAARKLK